MHSHWFAQSSAKRRRGFPAIRGLAPLLVIALLFQGLLAQVHVFSHLSSRGDRNALVSHFATANHPVSTGGVFAPALTSTIPFAPDTAPGNDDERHCPLCLALSGVGNYVNSQPPVVVPVTAVRIATKFLFRRPVSLRAIRTPAQSRGPPVV
jgi:hypothetical protein